MSLEMTFYAPGLDGCIADLRRLLDLEMRSHRGQRLDSRAAVTLSALRYCYPAPARRLREEVMMGEDDEDRLIAHVLEVEGVCEMTGPGSAVDDLGATGADTLISG